VSVDGAPNGEGVNVGAALNGTGAEVVGTDGIGLAVISSSFC